MMNENKSDYENIRELGDEELEDVASGGIKEIVAGVTLAAMTVTGAPVSAFGMAKAMAEGPDAVIEAAPVEAAYGIEYTGELADAIEAGSGMLEAPPEEMMFALGGEEEEAPAEDAQSEAFVSDAIAAEDAAMDDGPEAAENEVSMALTEDGVVTWEEGQEEAPQEGVLSEAETKAEERRQLMAGLIESAMQAHADEGIYCALDSVFDTLEENAAALANPENGVIEISGDEIISMTENAMMGVLWGSLITPVEKEGAINASIDRSNQRNIILSGVLPGSKISVDQGDPLADVVRFAGRFFDSTLDGIAVVYPNFKPFVPILKAIGGDVFGTKDNSTALILDRMDDIQRQINDAARSVMTYTADSVTLEALNGRYTEVTSAAEQIQTNINDINGNPALSAGEKIQRIADMKNGNTFSTLETGMNLLTQCFTSNVNSIFDRQSIFDAAYSRACSQVMFSSEAIDLTMPYIARQFGVYLAAYNVMDQVYDAYEKVYGADSLTATRKMMLQRLGGVDLNQNHVSGSVTEAIKAYAERDKFIFVNRGSCNIALDRGVRLESIRYSNINPFPRYQQFKAECRDMPLSAAQMEALCGYAASKGRSLFDFMFNDMHFAPIGDTSKKIGGDSRPFLTGDISLGLYWPEVCKEPAPKPSIDPDTYLYRGDYNFPNSFNEKTQTWSCDYSKTFFLDGSHNLQSHRASGRRWLIAIDALNATSVWVDKNSQKDVFYEYNDDIKLGDCNWDVLILLPR